MEFLQSSAGFQQKKRMGFREEKIKKMEKLKMHTPDFTDKNIAKLAELFPNCVTESQDEKGNLKKSIDFDLLKQELSDVLVEERQERYRLDWPGKLQALLTANRPIAKTLRPCREESIDFDNTKNLFIEGDNLNTLKLLQETYLGKVKMIYIDPPYNTGNDFIYKDDFSENTQEYLVRSGQKNGNGERLVANTDSNGRFHSDWCSMMYSRLKVARNLLRDDGMIFVSIDDNELHNLRKVCDEVFGQSNFIGNIIWNSTKSVTNTALLSTSHTYNLCYSKNKSFFIENRSCFRFPESGEGFSNPDNDPRGSWKADPFQVGGVRPNQLYEIKNPKTGEIFRPNNGNSWKNDYKKFQKLVKDNRIVFGVDGSAGPQRKRFLNEALERGRVAKTLWDKIDTTTNATKNVKKLFNGVKIFDSPKPISLLKNFIKLGDHGKNGIVMDFFSGSATTAHAVMQLNAEDGGKRKFIMVQLPEKCDKDSEAFKNGYKTIADIGRERIRRAGAKIKQDNPEAATELDIGFRSLKVDSSNMNDVYYTPEEYTQDLLSKMVDKFKEDRTFEDLLFQAMLDWGIPLDLSIKKEVIEGQEVFFVDENTMVACFAKNGEVTEDFCKKLISRTNGPLKMVFRDQGFRDDSAKINTEQIFKMLAPHTEVRVI